jgi:hypothetical protein
MPPVLRRNSPYAAHDPTNPQIDWRIALRDLHRRLGVAGHFGLSGVFVLIGYFIVAGMGWCLPAGLIIRWMAKPDPQV